VITLLVVVSGVKLRVMKTLGSADDKEEILRRMENVRPDSRRLWGKMSAHQMICHLSDGLRMYMGKKKVAPVGGLYPSKMLRWIALWAPLRWPKGFQTMKELDQQAIVPTADELRKGVNVLTTSDPRNPAKNPFVQQQSTQNKSSNNGSKSDKT